MNKAEFIKKWYSYGGLREIMESDLDTLLTEIAREQRIECANYNEMDGIMGTPLVTDKTK